MNGNDEKDIIRLYLEGKMSPQDQLPLNQEPSVTHKRVTSQPSIPSVFINNNGRNQSSSHERSDATVLKYSDGTRLIGRKATRTLVFLFVFLMVAGLTTFIVLHFWASSGTHTQRLYTEYFKPYDNVFIQRGGSGNQNQDLDQAMSLYDQGLYSESVNSFERYFATDTASDAALLYYAISCMEGGNPDKSIQTLHALSSRTESLFCEQAEWYLGLAYLKTGNKTEARKIFENILLYNSYSQDKALLILKDL